MFLKVGMHLQNDLYSTQSKVIMIEQWKDNLSSYCFIIPSNSSFYVVIFDMFLSTSLKRIPRTWRENFNKKLGLIISSTWYVPYGESMIN